MFGEVVDIFDVDVGLVDEVALPEAVAADDVGAGGEALVGEGEGVVGLDDEALAGCGLDGLVDVFGVHCG